MSQEPVLRTPRLVLGPWSRDDATAALAIFGREEVTHWLTPALSPVHGEAEMADAIERWAAEDAASEFPVGHWAVRTLDDDAVVGSITLRRLPPERVDLELAWQFAPAHWGSGYATEAAHAVAQWAFENSAHELFAVTRPANDRAVKLARRLGMQWVGETEKYYGLRLDVFRVRPPELLGADDRRP